MVRAYRNDTREILTANEMEAMEAAAYRNAYAFAYAA